MSDFVEKVSAVWDRKALEAELEQASAKLVEQAAEIERLREKCDKQAMIIRRSYPENFPDTWFVAGGIGEKDQNGLPKLIEVCPAYGVDWTQIYERTDRTIGGMGS